MTRVSFVVGFFFYIITVRQRMRGIRRFCSIENQVLKFEVKLRYCDTDHWQEPHFELGDICQIAWYLHEHLNTSRYNYKYDSPYARLYISLFHMPVNPTCFLLFNTHTQHNSNHVEYNTSRALPAYNSVH